LTLLNKYLDNSLNYFNNNNFLNTFSFITTSSSGKVL